MLRAAPDLRVARLWGSAAAQQCSSGAALVQGRTALMGVPAATVALLSRCSFCRYSLDEETLDALIAAEDTNKENRRDAGPDALEGAGLLQLAAHLTSPGWVEELRP